MNISLKQKRYLIVWSLFNVFALSVNIIPIKGLIKGNENMIPSDLTYVFTNGYSKVKGFWPFVNFNNDFSNPYWENGYHFHHFRGIFAGYDFAEFAVYILIGFAVVFLPKIWK
ncbi:MAG: hypothetical protein JNL72_05720 [Flavipsychrobacter sp.]|nr:hypothetical protein [Flavipsychrobacter sp.]